MSSSKHVVVAVVQAVLFSDENIFLIYLEIWEWGMGNGEWGIESDLICLKQIKSEYISLVIASCFAISDFLFGIPHCC